MISKDSLSDLDVSSMVLSELGHSVSIKIRDTVKLEGNELS